jgi:hypothetical protein
MRAAARCAHMRRGLPELCHRSLVADNMLWQGSRVFHWPGPGVAREGRWLPDAREHDCRLIYNRDRTMPLDRR